MKASAWEFGMISENSRTDSDRELAKKVVIEVFNTDLKGEVGRMARNAVPKADKADIVNRVHALIQQVRDDERRSIR